MQKYRETITDRNGNALPGVSVLVKNYPAGTTATIYSDSGVTTTANPLTTDQYGVFQFYAADGRYSLTISGANITTTTLTDIPLLEDPADPNPANINGGTISNSALSNVTIDGIVFGGGDIAKYSRLNDADGSSLVGFIQSGTDAVARTEQEKLRDTVSVKDFGADASGLTSSLTAFTAAYDAVSEGGRIKVPHGNYAGVSGTLTGTKFVIWEIEGNPNGGGLWNLPGLIKQGFTTREITAIQQTVADGDLKNSFVRNTSHSGGTSGFVCTNVSVTTTVGAGVTNFEWGLLSVLNNNAAVGENVAAYMQGRKNSTGPTWAAVHEVIDTTNTADPASGAVACEVDVRANGTDANNNRIGTHYVVGQAVTGGGGAACEAYAAVLVDRQNIAGDVGTWKYGAVIKSATEAGIRMQQSGKMGIDFSAATFSDTVPNMAMQLASDQRINFSVSATRTLRYSASATALRYANGSATLLDITDSGAIKPTSNVEIQTVGAGLRVKEGSNAKQGVATLVAGAVTVSNTSVTANSRIFLTSQADGGTPGFLRVSARSAGVSFTITSSSGTDTSTVAYQIFEPA